MYTHIYTFVHTIYTFLHTYTHICTHICRCCCWGEGPKTAGGAPVLVLRNCKDKRKYNMDTGSLFLFVPCCCCCCCCCCCRCCCCRWSHQTHRAAGLENTLECLELGVAFVFCISGEQPRCCFKQKLEAGVTIPCHVYNGNVTSNPEILKKQDFLVDPAQSTSSASSKVASNLQAVFWSLVSLVLCL